MPSTKQRGAAEGEGARRPGGFKLASRLNFPTIAETAFAEGEGMPPQKKRK